MILLPVFSCFSLTDLSSVEIETAVDVSRLTTAENVNLGVVGSFRNPVDPKTAVIFNEMGFRVVFPTTDSEFFNCNAEEKYLFVKENCSTGTSISEYGEYIYYAGETFTFDATKFSCVSSECNWKLSLAYLEFPREYLIWCWNDVVWSCKIMNKSIVLGYGDAGVKRIMNETLDYLIKNRIIYLDSEDIEKIVNVSYLGYSGYNNRLVNFEGEWMSYQKVEGAQLSREMTIGGCSEGETIPDIPEKVLSFSNPSENMFSILFRKFFEFFGFKF